MTRRLLLRFLLIASLGAAVLVVYLYATAPNHRINQRSFDQIAVGMSLPEVEKIVRCPPGNYCSGPIVMFDTGKGLYPLAPDHLPFPPDKPPPVYWISDKGLIVLHVDAERNVTDKSFLGMHEEGVVAKVRNWLHLD